MGGRLADLIGTTHAVLFLISDRVVEVLRRIDATGWATYPVTVQGKDGALVAGYQGLAVDGRAGPEVPSASADVTYHAGAGVRPFPARLGIFFDPATWDGRDVFLIRGAARVIVTERVRAALEAAKITNAEFKPLTEVMRRQC
jgi:hypothetical protein